MTFGEESSVPHPSEKVEEKGISLGKRWLILGGAGYIGSHVLREFIRAGIDCVVFDNLATGIEERVPREVPFVKGNALNSQEIVKVCEDYGISGVVHMAAFMQARESVRDPIKFWTNNLGATLGLASSLSKTLVKHVIFSSSCSVYGSVSKATEDSPLQPVSPYALTKLASEQVLTQACSENDSRLTILRYFNVIGCDDFAYSPDQSAETLLPASARHILSGEPPVIFGGDLPTSDGTAIRDYLDVRDVASAHRVVTTLGKGPQRNVFNVSRGVPVSVKAILSTLLEVSGSTLVPQILPPKEGDPAEVWADGSSQLARMGWIPKYDLRDSIRDYWNAATKVHS